MDLKSPEFLPYIVIGSVALAVLAVILYYIPGGKIKVPAIVVTGLTCLIAGIGIGVLILYRLGYHWERETSTRESPFGAGGGPPNIGGGRGGPGGGSRRGGGSGGGGATGQGPSSKSQLATLVAKLDELTRKPPTLKLNDEQKAKIQDQLKGLEDKQEISEEGAKKTLDALLEIVKENKEALEAAGYRGPGQAGAGSRPAIDIPNPFKEKADGDHLKSLREQLRQGDRLDSKIPPGHQD